ncbi:MAG: hypothetical protein FWD57_06665, partial [Polyangiaceae bacterium]|nr:hypothetical protein [Polyangiaceae bacterium]
AGLKPAPTVPSTRFSWAAMLPHMVSQLAQVVSFDELAFDRACGRHRFVGGSSSESSFLIPDLSDQDVTVWTWNRCSSVAQLAGSSDTAARLGTAIPVAQSNRWDRQTVQQIQDHEQTIAG